MRSEWQIPSRRQPPSHVQGLALAPPFPPQGVTRMEPAPTLRHAMKGEPIPSRRQPPFRVQGLALAPLFPPQGVTRMEPAPPLRHAMKGEPIPSRRQPPSHVQGLALALPFPPQGVTRMEPAPPLRHAMKSEKAGLPSPLAEAQRKIQMRSGQSLPVPSQEAPARANGRTNDADALAEQMQALIARVRKIETRLSEHSYALGELIDATLGLIAENKQRGARHEDPRATAPTRRDAS